MSITICILVDIDRDKACADQQEGKKKTKNKRKWKQRNHLICGDVSSSFADNMKAKTLWMKYNFEEASHVEENPKDFVFDKWIEGKEYKVAFAWELSSSIKILN